MSLVLRDRQEALLWLRSLPDGHNIGVCQSGEVGKGGVGHHCVHHGLGHHLAEGPGLGPLKDLGGREGGLGSCFLHGSPGGRRGTHGAYLRRGVRSCRQWRLLGQDVPDVVDPHVALLVSTQHDALICQDIHVEIKGGAELPGGGWQDGGEGGGSPGQVLSEK